MALLPLPNSWAPFSLIYLLLTTATLSHAIWPFPSKRFSANAFVDAQGLGLEDAGRIVAFGDFNGDQFLDVVTINEDQNMISIHTWSHELFAFFKNSTLQSPGLNPIINVVPGDFTHDGKLDILVMTAPTRKANQLDMFLYVGSVTGGFEPSPVSIAPSTLAQPIPLDFNGNLRLDMIGHTQEDDGSLTLWKNVWERTNGSVLFDSIPSELPTPLGGCILSNPHSSAILDFDGDCLADLFLICDSPSGSGPMYQIYLNDQDGGFKLGPTGTLPKGAGMVSFADMDRDGTIDLVFPVCESVDKDGVGHGCSINIAYNKQRPFCASSSIASERGRTCRRPDELCTADPNFNFDLSSQSKTFISIPISDLLRFSSPPSSSLSSILMYDNSHHPPLPLPLKLGDADLDGFPEILFIAVNPAGERIPKLAWSVPCSYAGEPGCSASSDSNSNKRGYFVATGGDVAVLETFRDARSVSFLDMDEDGTLDILVQRTGSSITGQKVNFVQNNVFHDAFFMKAIVLNGACGGMCVPKNPAEPKYHPFGVSYSGATYKYTILDTSGKRSAAQISQLPQTSYHALQTPYSFFGLGRTNNYIENLFVGSTRKLSAELPRAMTRRGVLNITSNSQRYIQGGPETSVDHKRSGVSYIPPSGEGIHYISMEGVIPNSKVVIIPPSSPGAGAGEWKRELYLRPGEWIPWVTVTLVVATMILGIIVWIFHWNEKREDELERRRALHSINFDAL